MPEDELIDENDNEMTEFQTKISEERHNSKKMSKGEYDLSKDLSEVEKQLKKIDLKALEKNSSENVYEDEEEEDVEGSYGF